MKILPIRNFLYIYRRYCFENPECIVCEKCKIQGKCGRTLKYICSEINNDGSNNYAKSIFGYTYIKSMHFYDKEEEGNKRRIRIY